MAESSSKTGRKRTKSGGRTKTPAKASGAKKKTAKKKTAEKKRAEKKTAKKKAAEKKTAKKAAKKKKTAEKTAKKKAAEKNAAEKKAAEKKTAKKKKTAEKAAKKKAAEKNAAKKKTAKKTAKKTVKKTAGSDEGAGTGTGMGTGTEQAAQRVDAQPRGFAQPAEESGGRRRRRRRSRRRGKDKDRHADPLARAARKTFGIANIRPQQRQAMEAIQQGRDTLAVLPTGFGKSLVYQLTGLLSDRPTLVVSPLLALIADQTEALRRKGVPVIRLDSSLRAAERRDALARLEAGGTLIVLTTPETVESKRTGPLIARAEPWLLCVDEAHCISEWGHDFRPAYLRLGLEREKLGHPTLLALTATATPRVQDDIIERLALKDPLVISTPPYRENLQFSVQMLSGNMKIAAAGKRLRRLQRPGIVYCSTTKAVDGIWNALQTKGVKHRIPTLRYHGKMSGAERKAAQERFMLPSKRLVMVATSAFGMGVDKPNIRYVVHYQAPGSIEQYVQEAGRAGRDGKNATCELLFDPDDLDIQRFLLSKSRPSARQLLAVAKALTAWAEEDRPVTIPDLAVSARVSQTVARSMASQLEGLGLLEQDDERRYVVLVSAAQLREGAEQLAGRLETLARQDEKRLQAVADYAATTQCRAAFLRRYFGEDDPPACGVCDRCRADKRLSAQQDRLRKATRQATEGQTARPDSAGTKGRRRRRRRRGGKRRRGGGSGKN